MPRISYAQNGEDIVLMRAFADKEVGFYIDVGAADPRADSVTKLFSDRGWHGINIEPQDAHYRDLVRERPRDINLKCGLGEAPGARTFVVNRDIPGWSTFSDVLRDRYRAERMQLEQVEIELRTLADVCDEFAPDEIDFLKVDVEGFEYEVLAGGDWKRHRPRIIVIEATMPERWERLLAEASYRQTLFDGINRFYVREEDADLAQFISSPVNILDDHLLWLHADHIEKLEAHNRELELELARLRGHEVEHLKSRIRQLDQELTQEGAQLVELQLELDKLRSQLSAAQARTLRARVARHLPESLKAPIRRVLPRR